MTQSVHKSTGPTRRVMKPRHYSRGRQPLGVIGILLTFLSAMALAEELPTPDRDLPHIASASEVINLPLDDAWAKLRDLTAADRYVPGLSRVEITTDATEGLGASRRVYQGDDDGFDETVVEWTDGAGFLIRLHDGENGPNFPLANAFFRYHIEPANSGSATRATLSLSYAIRGGWFGRAMHPLIGGAIRSRIRTITANMKAYYESD